ncbi:hypothetical protein D3C75_917660 [compost metagenome]
MRHLYMSLFLRSLTLKILTESLLLTVVEQGHDILMTIEMGTSKGVTYGHISNTAKNSSVVFSHIRKEH